jgi:micrococcal nuclease
MRRELRIINAAVFALVAFIYFGARSFVFTSDQKSFPADHGRYMISRVVDGDTVVLSDGRKVRLIGIDTPEVYFSEKLLKDSKKSGQDIDTIQALGKRASEFTKKLCLGKKVRVEYDVEKKDRYGRTLAYIYLEDGTFVNAKIVEEGFAQVLTIPPNVKYSDQFIKLQAQARESGKGLWKT